MEHANANDSYSINDSAEAGRLAQTAISGSPVLDEDSAPETEFSTGSPTHNQGQESAKNRLPRAPECRL